VETVRKTYKEKLRPAPAQERARDDVLWRGRTRSNTARAQRVTAWQRCHVSVSRVQQEAEWKAIRAELPAYAAIHSQVLHDVLARLDTTSQAFFRRVQRGEKAGVPRCKGRNRWQSFTVKAYGNGARLENGARVLAKIGRLSVQWSRPLAGTPKTVTISKEAAGWYGAIACADVPPVALPRTGQETGIDRGLERFAPLAAGRQIATPRSVWLAEMGLKRAQRRVSRRTKGSQRRRKAGVLLAQAHQHVHNQRRTVHHQEACKRVQQDDVISHEDLRVRNMVQNHSLATSIADAGWSAFLTLRTFTAASAGKRVQAVNPAFTSQACSGCGARVSKGRSVRWHTCPDCGTSLQRDHTAALNLLRLGQEHSGPGDGLQARTQPVGANVA
jgi:putative transposase